MNSLRQWLVGAKNTWTRLDADVAVWNRVVYGISCEYPVTRREETNHSGFSRRSSDIFPPLTGEELKARLLELA